MLSSPVETPLCEVPRTKAKFSLGLLLQAVGLATGIIPCRFSVGDLNHLEEQTIWIGICLANCRGAWYSKKFLFPVKQNLETLKWLNVFEVCYLKAELKPR